MKNISVYFLLLIGGLFTPFSEVNAVMLRSMIDSSNGPINAHIFCPNGKSRNVFSYIDLREENVSYGFKLRPQNYYKSFEKFKKQPEYLLNEWEIWPLSNFAGNSLGPCIFRVMSDETALDFMKQYYLNCALPRKPKKYCFKN